ncbi:MAG: SDR family oxidoreductase [Bacteroidota bacterium]
MSDLTDTTVLVTGASGRLGRVLLRHLADAGATVAGIALDAPSDPPAGLHFALADATDEAALQAAFAALRAEAGPFDVVIHAVGMWDGGPLAETTLDAWTTVMDVNLTASFLCVRESVQLFLRDGGGRLVGIASQQGADGAPAQQAAYAASKAGLIRLFEAAAAEHADDGIQALTIAPSMLLFGGEDPATRGVSAEDVAALCAHLCTDAGAAHNGATLRMYGAK